MKTFVFIIKILVYAALWLILDDYINAAIIVFMAIYVYQMIQLAKENSKLQKGNYSIINFNVFFFLMYTLCTFIIPFFHLIGFNDFSLFLPINFKDSYIPKSLFLSSVAVESFTLGYIRGMQKKSSGTNLVSYSSLDNAITLSTALSILITFYFIYDFVRSRDAGIRDVGGQATALVTCFSLLPVLLCGYRNKYLKNSLPKFLLKNWIPFGILTFISLCMLSIGDRLITVCLLSAVAFIINEYVYKIKTPVFIVSALVGFLLLFLVSLTRGTDMSIGEGYQFYRSSDEKFLAFQDVYPANATYLVGIEVKETKGYYKPLRILPYALNPIPFIPGFLKDNLFDGEIASAMYITMYNRSQVRIGETGLGTHVVGDIYMSWGVLGVIVMFTLLGYLIGLCYIRRGNIYYMIAYAGLVSWAVFMPRESVFDPYRNVVWMLALTAIFIRSKSSQKRLAA